VTTLREGHRIAARAFGRGAETLVADWLTAQGYRILARKFTIRGGEIDIIAARGDSIAFVEVKARATVEAALASITESQRRRLARAAAAWVTQNPFAADGYALRGDAVVLDARRSPLHIENAFALDVED
jgi:putative endonuclease